MRGVINLLNGRGGINRNGLLAEYRFDEGSGTMLRDWSGNGHNATLGGTTNGTAGTWNAQGLFQNGVFNCVALPSSIYPSWPNVRTIQLWVRNTVPTGLDFGKYRSWIGTNVEPQTLFQWAHDGLTVQQGPGTTIGRVFATDVVLGNVGISFVYGSPGRLFLNGREALGYVKQENQTPSATTPTNILIGGFAGASSITPNFAAIGNYYYAAIYTRPLSVSEIASNHAHVSSLLARRGVTIRNELPNRSAVICDGDSITLGSGSGTSLAYPIKLDALMTNRYNYANYGISGQTVASIASNASLKMAGINSVGGAGTRVYILFAGTNDMAFAPNIATATYNNIRNAAQAAKNAGYSVVVASTMSRGGGLGGGQTVSGFETDRTAMNSLLRADFPTVVSTNIRSGASYADLMVDVGADSNLGQSNSHSNLTFFGDTIHPTAAGNDIIAGYMRTALQQFGLS